MLIIILLFKSRPFFNITSTAVFRPSLKQFWKKVAFNILILILQFWSVLNVLQVVSLIYLPSQLTSKVWQQAFCGNLFLRLAGIFSNSASSNGAPLQSISWVNLLE